MVGAIEGYLIVCAGGRPCAGGMAAVKEEVRYSHPRCAGNAGALGLGARAAMINECRTKQKEM